MGRLIVRRVLSIIPIFFLVTLLAFALVQLVPGDTARTIAGETASPERIEEVRKQLGLNDSTIVQYTHWMGDLLRGDLGNSLLSGRPVTTLIKNAIPATISLALAATVLALVTSIPPAVVSALRPKSFIDRTATLGASLALAVPSFWLGLVLVLVFSVKLSWFPAIGYVGITDDPLSWLSHLILPGLALGAAVGGAIYFQLRGSMLDVLDQDYVRTARAKGLGPAKVIGKHTLKNAAIPVVTLLGLQLGRILGGAVLVEIVFGLPGLGRLTIKAVLEKDIPVVQGVVIVTTVVVLFVNLLVDISYGYFNPKVRAAT